MNGYILRTLPYLKISIFILIFSIVSCFITSCSPLYVARAAYEETKILLARKDIQSVVANPETSEDERRKLSLVLQTREFAKEMGLDPGNSFTKYTRVDRDVLAWVLVACKPDSFSLRKWWFPIVGNIPYKGFFDKEDAERAASGLEEEGYETWVRGTEAFSTLGWFNDPVLSTTLKHADERIVNTVIHESVHSTVWIPSHVDFNETLANYVGTQGASNFYESHMQKCGAALECTAKIEPQRKLAEDIVRRELEFSHVITALYDELDKLYKSSISREEKLGRRIAIFNSYIEPLRLKYPTLKALKSINNAEIIQLHLYLKDFESFGALYKASGHDWHSFIEKIRVIRDKVKDDAKQDPYILLHSFF